MTRITTRATWGGLVLWAALLTMGCQEETGEAGDDVAQFFGAGDTAALDFASGDAQYLVAVYSVAESGESAFSATVAGQEGASASQAFAGAKNAGPAAVRARRQPLAESQPALWQRWQRRLATERWTRELREQAAAIGDATIAQRARALRDGDLPQLDALIASCGPCGALEVCQGSCTATPQIDVSAFAVLSGTETITAEVRRKGDVVAILVDQDVFVDDAALDALRETFEDVIYPRSLALFGRTPLTDGESQLAFDRNNDGLVWLVITDKVSERDDAVGFFVATDFTEEPSSNQADILYLVPPDETDHPLETIFPIVAHEFQHLLHYSTKVYKRQVAGETGTIEALWLDEGLAHFAEDACGFGGQNVTLLDQELVNMDQVSLFASDDSLALRALALTYVRYLFEQKGAVTYSANGDIVGGGGAAWLTALHHTAQVGTLGIDATAPPTFNDYRAVVDGWVAAVGLDGRGVTTDARYIYQPLVNDPLTQGTIGLKIRGARADAEGEMIMLEGPLETDLGNTAEDVIRGGSVRYYRLAGRSGIISVRVDSEDPDVRFAILRN